MTSETEHWQTIQNMLLGYRAAHVLITCTQLNIFNLLADSGQTASALGEQTQTDPSALRRLLDSAVALDLLTKNGDTYINAPLAETCLAEEGPFHLGNMVRREGAFYQRWSYLTEAVKTGRRPEANIRDESQENWVFDFEMALFDLARAAGPVVAEILEFSVDRPIRVLDVGGGHGGYSMALTRRYPNIEATVFELPQAADAARQIIANEGMSDRITVQDGDFQKEELGRNFDVVLLFGVLVSETADGKIALLQKSFRALKPGGMVVIRGFWLNEDRTAPLEATIFSLQMLLATDAGDISTTDEMEDLLKTANFENLRQITLPDWISSSLYLAQKPQ